MYANNLAKELIPSTSAEISLFSVKVHVFDVLAK